MEEHLAAQQKSPFNCRVYATPKNRQITGTFNENAFQATLFQENEDPLQIKLFDQLGLACRF
jgi:hypothetical protein